MLNFLLVFLFLPTEVNMKILCNISNNEVHKGRNFKLHG